MGMEYLSDERLFHYSLLTIFLIGPPTFISLRFLQAPYGKHRRPGWGPSIPPSVAWFFMESPTVWITLLLFPFGRHSSDPKSLILISIFLFHYLHRTIIYPLRLLRSSGNFPIWIALMGFSFNLINAYVQTRSASHYADMDRDSTFWIRLIPGVGIFLIGMIVNVRSDYALTRLKGGDGGYKIPRGGLFELVSCPNYFGEIVEWLGWGVMSWTWSGLAFFLYTCANLVPRARANHLWYSEKFREDYPKGRKAVIPFMY